MNTSGFGSYEKNKRLFLRIQKDLFVAVSRPKQCKDAVFQKNNYHFVTNLPKSFLCLVYYDHYIYFTIRAFQSLHTHIHTYTHNQAY